MAKAVVDLKLGWGAKVILDLSAAVKLVEVLAASGAVQVKEDYDSASGEYVYTSDKPMGCPTLVVLTPQAEAVWAMRTAAKEAEGGD